MLTVLCTFHNVPTHSPRFDRDCRVLFLHTHVVMTFDSVRLHLPCQAGRVCVCVCKRLYMATDSAFLPKDFRGCCATLFPSRRGCANIFSFPHGERRHFLIPAGGTQGAQARLGYLCQRSYSKMGEGWSDQPPVPASMASPKYP